MSRESASLKKSSGNCLKLIAYFLGNMCAKYYENPAMLSRVAAKNVGDVF